MNQGREFGWNDQIENDGEGFILLDEGDYEFKIVKFDRGRFNGSAKMPACNMAVLEVEVTAPNGQKTTITKQLLLHSKMEWLLCQFFTAIGHRQHGERLSMDWNRVMGATGWLHISHRTYTATKGKRQGEELTSMEIDRWHDPQDFQPETTEHATTGQYPAQF